MKINIGNSWRTIGIILVLFVNDNSGFALGTDTNGAGSLFANDEPLQLTIQMDMRQVLTDKSEDTPYTKALLIQKLSDKQIQTYNIKIKARGHTRRIQSVCEFPPLKINFQKKATINTVFDGQDKIKLVTHCQESDEFQNYAMLEYLIYKTYNLVTDYSFRVRLVRVVYQDTGQKFPDIEKTGFLIEDDDLLAERVGGEITNQRIWRPDSCDQQAVDVFSMFQFMIGNTDWWIHTRHNVEILKLNDGRLIPLPYDFDYAGIVNTPYAVPSPELPIGAVRDRFFKGLCNTVEEYLPEIDLFNDRKNAILSLLDEAEFLDKKYCRTSIRYVEEFYRIINDREDFSAYLDQSCAFNKGKLVKR